MSVLLVMEAGMKRREFLSLVGGGVLATGSITLAADIRRLLLR